MNEASFFILAFAMGVFLGAMFFGGLWWTVRKGVASQHPAVWFFGSLLLRMSITLGGFFLVGRGHWERLLVCLVGFVIARLAVMWFIRPSRKHPSRRVQEATHATES